MRIDIDLDTNLWLAGPSLRYGIPEVSFKRDTASTLEVRFWRSGIVVALADGALGEFGIKTSGAYDSDLLVHAATWTQTGTGETTVYEFAPAFDSSALAEALGHGNGDITDDESSIVAMAEILWTIAGKKYRTQTVPARIGNDVLKDTDATPQALPTPDDWLAQRASTTPTPEKLVKADEDSKIEAGWLPDALSGDGPPIGEVIGVNITSAAFPDLNGLWRKKVSLVNGKPYYFPDGGTVGVDHLWYEPDTPGGGPGWELMRYNTATLYAQQDVATPDLVVGQWNKDWPTTGDALVSLTITPSFTNLPASYVGQLYHDITNDTWYRWDGDAWERLLDESIADDRYAPENRSDSRLWNFRNTMHNSQGARPRICFIGDSMIGTARTGGFDKVFKANFGDAGYGFIEGFATAPATLEKDACLKWITGETFLLPLTGIATFGASAAYPVAANTIKIYYLRQPGGGHFKIQTERNGGAWTDEAGYTDIDTDGELGGVVVTITKPVNERWSAYRVRCVGLGDGSGGAANCTIIGAGLYHSKRSGGIYSWMYNGSTDSPNNNTVSAKNTPRAITDPIFADLGLHLVVVSNYDGAASATNDLPVLLDNIKAGLETNPANPDASFLIIGPPCGKDEAGDANAKAQSDAMRELCRTRGDTFFDNRSWALPPSDAVANGLTIDGIHYTALAVKQWVPLMFSELGLASHGFQGYSAVNEIVFKQGAILRNQTVDDVSVLPILELEGSLRLCNPPGETGRAVIILEDSAGPANSNDVGIFGYSSNSIYFTINFENTLKFSNVLYFGAGITDTQSTTGDPRGVIGSLSAPFRQLYLGKIAATGTGDVTANRHHGSVKFPVGSATPIVVTNALSNTSATVIAQVYGADATLTSVRITRGATSFTITPNAAATAETEVGWFILS